MNFRGAPFSADVADDPNNAVYVELPLTIQLAPAHQLLSCCYQRRQGFVSRVAAANRQPCGGNPKFW
jgi:hypothetical protein